MSLHFMAVNSLINPDRTRTTQFQNVPNIHVDGTGAGDGKAPADVSRDAEYEAGIIMLLQQIYSTQTGRAVLNEIRNLPGHILTIRPAEKEGIWQVPSNVANANAARVKPFDMCIRPRKLMPNENSLLERCAAKVYGMIRFWKPEGDVDIRFTPGRFRDYIATHQFTGLFIEGVAGAQPDAVLLHEMVHALRMMRGIFNGAPIGFLYLNEEEYFAILIANIYASELRRVILIKKTDPPGFHLDIPGNEIAINDLRCNYRSFSQCSFTDEEFLPESNGSPQTDLNFRLVRKFIDQHPGTANALRYINCSFNPIRRYFELAEKRWKSVPVS